MKSNQMSTQLSSLSPAEQQLMLVLVCFYLTIVARDVFALPPALNTIERAKGISEITHKLTSNVASRMRLEESSYPNDVLIQIICELATKHGLAEQFEYAWDSALQKTAINRNS